MGLTTLFIYDIALIFIVFESIKVLEFFLFMSVSVEEVYFWVSIAKSYGVVY